jgi:hypothetical protein
VNAVAKKINPQPVKETYSDDARYNDDVSNVIKSYGANPRDIIFFNESLPASKIVRVGMRGDIQDISAIIGLLLN